MCEWVCEAGVYGTGVVVSSSQAESSCAPGRVHGDSSARLCLRRVPSALRGVSSVEEEEEDDDTADDIHSGTARGTAAGSTAVGTPWDGTVHGASGALCVFGLGSWKDCVVAVVVEM